jgi:hypothetical protein
MKEIIMFAGNIGSGKAYMMNKKVQELKETGNSIYLVSFADPIKTFVKDFIGLDKNGNGILNDKEEVINFYNFTSRLEKLFKRYRNGERFIDLEKYETQYELIVENIYQDKLENEKPDLRLKSIRSLLQIIGTEIGQSYNKEVWPEMACNKISYNMEYSDYVIVDDFRFLFEYYNIIRYFPDIKVTPYYVTADIEVRAKRRNITVEELMNQEKHISEQESKHVVLPWMKLHFPENIIENNGE